jgi:glc operon protein GlcG
MVCAKERHMLRGSLLKIGLLVVVLNAVPASAQLPNPYGTPINTDAAKKVAAAALAEARRNNWAMAAAVVDPAGDLVYFEKIDGTQAASVTIAVEKARSSARFKRPTKALQDQVAAGGEGLRLLGLPGAVPVEGGVPIVMDGRIVGAIGLSGGTSAQDGVAAAAGASTVK